MIQIIKTARVPAALCKRDSVKQFHDSKIRFPLTRRSIRCVHWLTACRDHATAMTAAGHWQHWSGMLVSVMPCCSCLAWCCLHFDKTLTCFWLCRPSDRKYKTVFKATRPNVAMF